MSIVTVQVGQCGNQIGYEFFQTVIREYHKNADLTKRLKFKNYDEDCLEVFFEKSLKPKLSGYHYRARSVLVDMEQKVVNHIVSEAKRGKVWIYNNKCQVLGNRGSGNNWAEGYMESSQQLTQSFEDALNKQAEPCDRLAGLMIQSALAGGTGSGLGSKFTSLVKDLFPTSPVICQTTWPHSSGEVAVQAYNTLLTITNTYEACDGILTSFNDDLYQTCCKSSADVNLKDMNKLLAKDLVFLLAPSSPLSTPSTSSSFSDAISDFVMQMCSHPHFKLCKIASPEYSTNGTHRFNTYHWPAVIKQLGHRVNRSNYQSDLDWLYRLNPKADIEKSYSHLLLLRGKDTKNVEINTVKNLHFKITYSSFNPESLAYKMHHRSVFEDEKLAMLVANDVAQMKAFDSIVDKAWNMYNNKAFLHQYQKFGLEENDFYDAFVSAENILHNYAHL